MKKLLMLGTSKASCEMIEYAKSQGIYTIVTDYLAPEKSKAKLIADEYWMISTGDFDTLEKKCREEHIDGVCSGISTFCIPATMELCKRLGLQAYCTPESWHYTMNKYDFKALCRSCNVPVATDYFVSNPPTEEELNNIKFPVVVKAVVTEEMLESKTIRECIQAFDISSQVVNVPTYKVKKWEVRLDITILKLLSIMRRLKIEDDEILKVAANLFYVDANDFCKYVAPFMLLLDDNPDDLKVSIYVKGEGSRLDLKEVFIDPKTGLGGNPDTYISGEAHEVTDFRLLFSSMLEYIVK